MNLNSAYRALAVAIVARAHLDVVNDPSSLGGTDKRHPEVIKQDAKDFLTSKWVQELADICSIPKNILKV